MSDSCVLNSEDMSNSSKWSQAVWWIDDEANWRHVKAESEQPYLRDPATSGAEALSFLYSWLGMIRIDVRATEIIVEWDVQNVQPVSLEKAKSFLVHVPEPQNISLHYCYGGWCRENFHCVPSALERLEEIEAYRYVVPFEGPTIHLVDLQRQDRERLQPPIRQALHIWESSKAEPDQGLTALFEAPDLLERTIIYRRGETGDLVYYRIGEISLFAQAYGHLQTSNLIGHNCALDPDHPTAQNPICDAYETVLASGDPRYDRLRAIYSRNGMRHWISCERLILPFPISRDKEFLISVCCALDTAAIPTQEGRYALSSDLSDTGTA